MATNGQSARKWLEENGNKVSRDRVEQIRKNIAEKLAKLDESDDSYPGLLEALDVMDDHLNPAVEEEATPAADIKLDLGPLASESDFEAPQLSPDEKKARFKQLLKSGQL